MSRAEAGEVLARFTAGYTEAYRRLDPALVDRVETGALAEIGRADVAEQRARLPKGRSANPGYPALKLDDARFTIPKSAGWPKFFLADTRSNRDRNRWLVVFARAGARAPWKAAYLTLHAPGSVPAFRTDREGWAVPAGDGLVLAPGAVSGAYADFLRTGAGDVFAPSGPTTQTRADRARLARTPSFRTDWIDTAAGAPDFPAVSLRTADGGAVVFFAAHHREKRTMARGVRPGVTERRTKALLSGSLRTAITYTRVSESAVRVPAGPAGGRGRVQFLNRIESLVAARGE
ncbi:hypothetical protein [Streptomyces sp. AV19]|uniref:hypothetical protein n=1 Tax=Streptomyces sp. AV19 TaxID=2793068 RepID=UPI00241348CD|nr:hypothetical protein [Streptomyces sp. AV19]MDG4532082.1 hypothetical protein [Streptomyces sp. AV19]